MTTGTEQEEKSTQGGAAAIAAVPRPSSPASAKAVLITGREPHQIEDSQAVYGHQPQIGASSDALAAFYGGDRTRILIAAVFYAIHQPRSATRQLFQPLTPGKYAI